MPHRLTRLFLLVPFALASGCHRAKAPQPAGSEIPTVPSSSVALPGANDAADAPGAPSVGESHDATLTLYRDPATGVSFRYPTIWRPSFGHALAAPEFAEVAGKPRITQEFHPEGTPYEPTVLRGLTFSYTVQAHSSASSCAALPKKASPNVSATASTTYNGVRYTEAHGGDAAMCTQVQSIIDTTLQGTECFIFERDFVTSCPFVKSQTLPRPLTNSETAALQRHLDAVMQSVTITPP